MQLVQHQPGQPRTRTATRAAARLILVIDWLPLFLPAMILIGVMLRPWFVVEF